MFEFDFRLYFLYIVLKSLQLQFTGYVLSKEAARRFVEDGYVF